MDTSASASSTSFHMTLRSSCPNYSQKHSKVIEKNVKGPTVTSTSFHMILRSSCPKYTQNHSKVIKKDDKGPIVKKREYRSNKQIQHSHTRIPNPTKSPKQNRNSFLSLASTKSGNINKRGLDDRYYWKIRIKYFGLLNRKSEIDPQYFSFVEGHYLQYKPQIDRLEIICKQINEINVS